MADQEISLDHLRAECYRMFFLQDAKGFEKNFEELQTQWLNRVLKVEEMYVKRHREVMKEIEEGGIERLNSYMEELRAKIGDEEEDDDDDDDDDGEAWKLGLGPYNNN